MAVRRLSVVLALCVLAMQPGSSQAQLLANVKNFLSNLPTFGSSNVPTFSVNDQCASTLHVGATMFSSGLKCCAMLPSLAQWLLNTEM